MNLGFEPDVDPTDLDAMVQYLASDEYEKVCLHHFFTDIGSCINDG